MDINSIDPKKLSPEEFARLLGAAKEADAEHTDIAEMDPTTFARLIKRAATDQIDAVVGDPVLRKPVLDAIFQRMAEQFRPDKAPRKDSAIHWNITGNGAPDVYETWIWREQDGTARCSTGRSLQHDPRVTLSMSGEQFLKLVSGNCSPTMMFMSGKLKLDGDIGFAAALTNFFAIPKA